jgi:phosphoglycolate phosphatase-like HAD superfamily hydrolase
MLWKWVNSGTHVFILDLDGTLMPSAEIDNECFWQAVFACFGAKDQLPDLQGFKNVTDSGILDEWCAQELGRPPRKHETDQIKHHFLQLLETAWKQQPQCFKPLPGVTRWLKAVGDADNVFAGIATGGWESSARLKLSLSGLERFSLPLASSDDAIARTSIMQIAARKTLTHATEDEPVYTYVGDGVWDLHASEELNWAFIGIASGARATQLQMAGASGILVDFEKP